METVSQIHSTRVLADEYDLYYDMCDMFSHAQEGEVWAEHWMCGRNRTLQVGDEVFLLDLPYRQTWDDREDDLKESYPDRGIFAHGYLIAGDAEEQLRELDSEAYGDLSAAYCTNPWREDWEEEDREEILFVRFKLDSIVDMEHVLPIVWLQQQSGCHDLFTDAPYSGDIIPSDIIPSLNDYWEQHVRKQEAEDLGLHL